MSQSVKTLIFAGVALLSLGVGFATHRIYKPSDLEGFSDVGMEFFPEFTDPNAVTGLRVASFNEETGQTDLFSVQFKDGTWRIPSHHDYPADGEDQLSTTAASMIGVERQALVERTKAAHKRYRLLDPLDQENSASEGFGDRITLTKGEEVVADFIVGMPVEGQENTYYVRAAGEDRFYTANLGEFEISTKFSDWILKDILDIERNNVNELVVDRYQVDEARGVVVQGDRLILNRDGAQADWQLEGLDGATEELNASNINAMLVALDDLSIVGVRKKPEGISADLKAEEGVSITAFDMLDLQDKGFFIDQRQGRILSNEGEVLVGTNDGVLYVLRFGEEFTGTDVDIEVGKKAGEGEDKSKESSEDEEEPSEEASENDEEGTDDASEESDDLTKSRYLFVTAQFDPALLGEKPTPPVKPEPPAQEADAEKSEETSEQSEAENNESAEQSEDASESNDEASDAQKEYEAALAQYEEDLEVYEIALRDYEEKLKAGEERVVDLNRRFADWYYVIGADVFDRMKLNRSDLVGPKEAEETNAPQSGPELSPPVEPEMTQPETTEATTNEEATTESETPQSEPETEKPEATSESEAEAKDSPSAEGGQEESADSERPPQPDLPEESPKNPSEGNSSEEPASTEPTADESGDSSSSESSESTEESASEEGTNDSEADNSESDSDS